jgi:hypothetical protein
LFFFIFEEKTKNLSVFRETVVKSLCRMPVSNNPQAGPGSFFPARTRTKKRPPDLLSGDLKHADLCQPDALTPRG